MHKKLQTGIKQTIRKNPKKKYCIINIQNAKAEKITISNQIIKGQNFAGHEIYLMGH
jgi:hypothetical protein